jgi:hypothetical protein
MDGPFWSMMPYGKTELSSLTSVGITPIYRSGTNPIFPCQDRSLKCNQYELQNCMECNVKPTGNSAHMLQQMSKHFLYPEYFKPNKSLVTVKTILKATEVDDARPTLIMQDRAGTVISVLSGKVSTVFDLEGTLA